ncbi:hypothetical protein B0H19DRAFT_1345705 [Mycena capillaripes]|nr:hypothetical protein B0H19DRAFT_1345705 [Mycena capillaripes]
MALLASTTVRWLPSSVKSEPTAMSSPIPAESSILSNLYILERTLHLAKASVGVIGMPQVEVSINGVRQLATMVFVARCVNLVRRFSPPGYVFTAPSRTLEPIRGEITTLIEQCQFFTGQEIKNFKKSITCCIQDFTKLVQDVVKKETLLEFKTVRGHPDDNVYPCPVLNASPMKQIEIIVKPWSEPSCSAVTPLPNMPGRIEPFPPRLLTQPTHIITDTESHGNFTDPGSLESDQPNLAIEGEAIISPPSELRDSDSVVCTDILAANLNVLETTAMEILPPESVPPIPSPSDAHASPPRLLYSLVLFGLPNRYSKDAQDLYRKSPNARGSPTENAEAFHVFYVRCVNEWSQLGSAAEILFSVLFTALQISSASYDPIVPTIVQLSIFCLFFGAIYAFILSMVFGRLEKVKGLDWIQDAERSTQNVFWNPWVMQSIPLAWVIWGVIYFAAFIMAFLWRAGASNEPDANSRLSQTQDIHYSRDIHGWSGLTLSDYQDCKEHVTSLYAIM